jgi:para-nitrobenzyl esterase
MKQYSFFIRLSIFSLLVSCNGKITVDTPKGIMDKGEIATATATVQTESGKVVGYAENGIYLYKGIPYAEAERFMPPNKPKAWEGVRSSRAYGPTCPQGKRQGWYNDEQAFVFNWDDGYPDEDCLRLNIWTKNPTGKEKHPVMVWLHGGGYSAGSGQELPSYDGENLCDKGDVVVVSLNHRLNVLGFLDLSAYGNKYAQSGNLGLLDLVAALQWIQNNISNFGGNPSNITIFGQSGGGGKVSTLLATPAAKGLFHKGIIQSGSMLQTMESKYSRRIGIAVVEELGLKPSQIDDIQNIPYEQLLSAGEKAVAKIKIQAEQEGYSSFIFGWAPTVDGEVLPTQPFAPQAPAQSKDIPLLIGTTQNEFCASAYVPAMRNITIEQAKENLQKKYGDKTENFLKAFAKAYPNYQPKDLIDVDFTFRPGAVEQAKLKTMQQGAPVYMYMFAWESPVLNGIFRSMHCMELPFVFNNIANSRSMTGGTKEAYALADKMSSAWINFAKTGNPNAEDLPEWEPYSIDKGATLFFNNTCEIKYNFDKELLDIVMSFSVRGF